MKHWEANPGPSGNPGSTLTVCASDPPVYLYAKGSFSKAHQGEHVTIQSLHNGTHYDSNAITFNAKSGSGLLDSIGDGSTPLPDGTWTVKYKEGGKTIATSSVKTQSNTSC